MMERQFHRHSLCQSDDYVNNQLTKSNSMHYARRDVKILLSLKRRVYVEQNTMKMQQ